MARLALIGGAVLACVLLAEPGSPAATLGQVTIQPNLLGVALSLGVFAVWLGCGIWAMVEHWLKQRKVMAVVAAVLMAAQTPLLVVARFLGSGFSVS